MSLYCAMESADGVIHRDQLQSTLYDAFEQFGACERVIAVPPDYTRIHSQAGAITCLTHSFYENRLVDVLPALGTHTPMEDWQVERMLSSRLERFQLILSARRRREFIARRGPFKSIACFGRASTI